MKTIIIAKWNKKGELSLQIKPNKKRYLFRDESGKIPVQFKDKRTEIHSDKQRLEEMFEKLKDMTDSMEHLTRRLDGSFM